MVSLFPMLVVAMVGGHLATAPEFRAVVRIGHCSGALVQPDVVLTSAHCLDGPIDEVVADGHRLRVKGCRRQRGYHAAQAQHDVGLCRLEAPAPMAPIPLYDGPALAAGAAVTMAGFGQSGAFARDGGTLHVVETVVTRVGPGGVEAGTDERTACLGDSGGPVIVRDGRGPRIAAVIHGGARAICASATEVVPVRDLLPSLSQAAISEASSAPRGQVAGAPTRAVAVALLAGAAGALVSQIAARRRGRSSAPSDEAGRRSRSATPPIRRADGRG